jgi:hypothetical protein
MTGDPSPKRFYWRIIPVMAATTLATALVYFGVSVGLSGGAMRVDMETLGLVLLAAGGVFALALLPLLLVWTVVFNWVSPRAFAPAMAPLWSQGPRPAVWRRAVWASLLTGFAGTVGCFTMLDLLTGAKGALVWALLPWALVPVTLGCILTWRAFRSMPVPEIGRRE